VRRADADADADADAEHCGLARDARHSGFEVAIERAGPL
jgi:hypothetical protein